MEKFKVYDNYEFDMELLGEFGSLAEAKVCAKERDLDTDGECFIVIIDSMGKRVPASV